MSRPSLTPQQLLECSQVAWADFRRHWPLHLFDLLMDVGAGTCLGIALGLSLVIYALERLA